MFTLSDQAKINEEVLRLSDITSSNRDIGSSLVNLMQRGMLKYCEGHMNELDSKGQTTYEVFKLFVKKYHDSRAFTKDVEKELSQLIEIVLDSSNGLTGCLEEDIARDTKNIKTLNTISLCQSLMSYLKHFGTDSLEYPSKCLYIFITLLEQAKERQKQTDFYLKQQNIIVDLGIVETLADLIAKSKVIQIVNLSIIVLQKLIDGPNSYSQGIILSRFKDPGSDQLFKTMEKFIMSSLESIMTISEQKSLYELHKNLRGKNNKQEFERIQINMEIEHFEAKITFIVNTFQLFILLMKGNKDGRAFMRMPIISEGGKQSFNLSLIAFSVKILSKLLKTLDPRSIELIDVILNFLLEAIIGPSPDNQDEVMKTNFVDCVKEVLVEYAEGIDMNTTKKVKDNKAYCDICTKAILVIKYLLEGNRNYDTNRKIMKGSLKTSYLLAKIIDDLKAYILKSQTPLNLSKLSEKPSDPPFVSQVGENQMPTITTESLKRIYNEGHELSSSLTNIFEQFFVYKMIVGQDLLHRNFLHHLDQEQRVTVEFLEEFSGSIEVVFEDKIHMVYLEIQPLFQSMSSEEMNLVQTSIRRDTVKNKVTDFINLMPLIFDLISYKNQLKIAKWGLSGNLYPYIEGANYILILIINGIMLVFFRKKLDYGEAITDPSFDESHPIMRVLVILHLVTTILRFVIFLFFEARVESMKQWRQVFENISTNIRHNEHLYSPEIAVLAKKKYVDLSFSDKIKLFEKYNQKSGASTNIPIVDFLFQSVFMLSQLNKFKTLALYTILTVWASQNRSFFCYSLLLLDIINFEANLESIVKSITINANQFILTAVFGRPFLSSSAHHLCLLFPGLRNIS